MEFPKANIPKVLLDRKYIKSFGSRYPWKKSLISKSVSEKVYNSKNKKCQIVPCSLKPYEYLFSTRQQWQAGNRTPSEIASIILHYSYWEPSILLFLEVIINDPWKLGRWHCFYEQERIENRRRTRGGKILTQLL